MNNLTNSLRVMRSGILAALVAVLAGCASDGSVPEVGLAWSVQPGTMQRAPAELDPRGAATLEGGDFYTLVRYARAHHPALAAARRRSQAAAEQAPQVSSLPDPSLTAGYESMRRESRVGVSQMIPFPGKLGLRGRAAEAEARAAIYRFGAEEQAVLQRLAQAYAEYLYVTGAEQIVAQNVELARQLEQVALVRVRGGAAQADVLRAQIELSRIEEELRSTQDRLRPAAASLNAALGRSTDAALPELAAAASVATIPPDDDVLAAFRAQNPELLELQELVEAAQTGLRLARRERLPDFMVGLEYMRDSMEDGVGVMFSINIPLWEGRNRAAIREAQLGYLVAMQDALDRRNALEAELQTALFNLRDADRKIALYRDVLLPRARQSLAATEAAYRAGTVDFLMLIDAYRLPLEFELALARAQADRAGRIAEVEALIGIPVSAESGDFQ